jgi:methylaspartate ammonia-lyase
MTKSQLLYRALEAKYEAQIAEAKATLAIYFESSVGIGEHPQHLEEMDKFVTQLTDAQDKLNTLKILQQTHE